MTDQIITVIARIKAKPGLEDSVRQELFKLLAPTRSEKGCINYDMHQSCDDASLFLFHENWSSDEDLRAHLPAPHIKSWFSTSHVGSGQAEAKAKAETRGPASRR